MASPLVSASQKLTVALAEKHRLPAIYARRPVVEGGGLRSQGAPAPLTYWVSAKAECRPEVDHLCSPKRQSASLCHSSVRVTEPGSVLLSLMRLPFPRTPGKMTMLWVKLPEQPSVCPVWVKLVV